MAQVSIAKTDSGIGPAVAEAVARLGGLDAFVAPGERVIVKPNLNGEEGFTHPDVTRALVELLRAGGAGEVVIAESTFGNAATTDRLFRKSGYVDLARELGVELVNLNRSEAVEVSVPDPLVLKTVRIAREVLEADRLINVPNMKVHYATGITVAMKNLKGVLVGDEKRRFHEVGLEAAIADLNTVVKPALNVVDAISCMERMGPRGGDLVEMNLLVAGPEAAAVDWVAAQVMGFAPEDIGHLACYAEKTEMDAANIDVLGHSVASVRRQFRPAEMAATLPASLTLHDGAACSACMNAFLLSCELLAEDPEETYDVYVGPKASASCFSRERAIAFGNCCPPDIAAGIRVKGCPPYPFSLREEIEKIERAG